MNHEDPDVKPKVKKYVMDPSKDWEARYRELEAHHEKETTWLIEEVSRLRRAINAHEDGYVCDPKRDPWDS